MSDAVLHDVQFVQRNDGDCQGVECNPFGVMDTKLVATDTGAFYSVKKTPEEIAEDSKCKGHPQEWMVCSCGYEELIEKFIPTKPFGERHHCGGISFGDERAMEAINQYGKREAKIHRRYEHILQSLMRSMMALEAQRAIDSVPIDKND